MPTVYPKCSPTELLGLIVALRAEGGAEDVARLARDLDLEIDEIIPSTEFSETLGLIRISDGRASLTEIGDRLGAASIRERKTILREQLKRTTLFKTLVQALESKPDRRLSEGELNALVEFTTAPADELVQNIINWGRFTELFRYDSDQRLLLPARARSPSRSPPTGGAPPGSGSEPSPASRPTRSGTSSRPPSNPPVAAPA